MKFTAAILALPALTMAQTLTTSVLPPPPAASPDPAICEDVAGGYARYCERCAPGCTYDVTNPERYSMCLNSMFTIINYYDSQCWQQGGRDCANQAVDRVCGAQ